MNRKLSLNFNAKIKPVNVMNDEFTLCKCYIMALGKNRNLSYFSKEAVESALPTLFNIPVIGHLIEKDDGTRYMGSHDMDIVVEDKNIYLKSICIPYGVVPNQENVYFETVNENGSEVEYLVANVILWTGRFPELKDAIYNDEIYFNQSMEINFSKYKPLEDDKNYTDILDFSFSALCMLGKSDNPDEHTEPCFPSARIDSYNFSYNDEFSKLMSEFKSELAFCFENKNDKEGGNKLKITDEIRDQILADFEITLDELTFEIDEDMTEEQFKEKVSEFANSKQDDSKPESFSLTYREKRDVLSNAFAPIVNKDETGTVIDETYFYVSDFDDTYVYIEKDIWSADGYKSEYGRYTYVFNEDMTVSITSEFEIMIMKWLTVDENAQIEAERNKYEEIQSAFETYKNEYSVSNTEVDELRVFKANILKKQRADAELEIFCKYEEKLKDVEEYQALKTNSKDFSLEEINDKCLIIAAKNFMNFSKSIKKENPIVKVEFEKEEHKEDCYGGLFEIYSDKN